ncbi:MAG: tetratricopeptide repeat protein, partial [Nitrospirae bacterium]|nr:tetratricopeptide repeat protein [Nitrospirota bacterium]
SKIKDANERLLFLVCSLFPSGLKKEDALKIIPELKDDDIKSLTFKSLIPKNDGNTFNMLAPIRNYAYGMFKKMIDENEIDIGIVAQWINSSVEKSLEYYNTTHGTGKRNIKELINELPDMFRVLDYLISKSEKDNLYNILYNLVNFLLFMGITDNIISFLEKARQDAQSTRDLSVEAKYIIMIGEIHLRESRNKDAMQCFNDALPLFKQVGNILGEANCIMRIGDIHFYESRNKDAMNSYKEALSIYKRVGDVSGEASCISGIGDIHLRESRNKDAMKSYNNALSLYKQVGNILGEANCIKGMGFCLIRNNHTDAGIKVVFNAIELYEKINDKYSMVEAYKNLGKTLVGKEGYQEKAMEYKKIGEEILKNIERTGQ